MQKSIAKNISMYEEDWETVKEVARQMGIVSASGGVRYIIRRFRKTVSQEKRHVAKPLKVK